MSRAAVVPDGEKYLDRLGGRLLGLGRVEFLGAVGLGVELCPTLGVLNQPRVEVMAGSIRVTPFLLATVVARAEKSERRPSGFARFSAGMGVIAVGASFGTMLTAYIKANPTGALAPKEAAKELAPASHVVLAAMLALLVIGLGWCFYRAIKASSTAAEAEQAAEGIDEA